MVRDFVLRRQGLLAAAAGAGIVLAAFWYAPHVEQGPILCLSHGLVGLPCPSCGLTRAFCLIARGEWWAAARLNLLAFPLFAACLSAPLAWLWTTLVRPVPIRRFLYSSRSAWWVGGIAAAYHGLRLVWWAVDGTLWSQYVQTSWTWRFAYWLFRA